MPPLKLGSCIVSFTPHILCRFLCAYHVAILGPEQAQALLGLGPRRLPGGHLWRSAVPGLPTFPWYRWRSAAGARLLPQPHIAGARQQLRAVLRRGVAPLASLPALLRLARVPSLTVPSAAFAAVAAAYSSTSSVGGGGKRPTATAASAASTPLRRRQLDHRHHQFGRPRQSEAGPGARRPVFGVRGADARAARRSANGRPDQGAAQRGGRGSEGQVRL